MGAYETKPKRVLSFTEVYATCPGCGKEVSRKEIVWYSTDHYESKLCPHCQKIVMIIIKG